MLLAIFRRHIIVTSTILKPLEKQLLCDEIPAVHSNADEGQVRFLIKPRVMVVIPCYNEEVSVGSMVLRSLSYADRVVVIDDGSTDKTADIARLAGAEVVAHEVNTGKGAGIRTAFEYARDAGMDILVLIDGDGQHNPDEIPRLIEPLLTGRADMVNGSRFLGENGHNVPGYRRIGQEILTLATNAGSRRKITDSQNGFRAFSRHTFDSFSFKEKGMGIESEMVMDAADAGLRIEEVPIDVRYDVNGSTYNPVVHGFSVLRTVLKTIAGKKQALIFDLAGLILLLLGAVTLSYLLLEMNSISGVVALSFATVSILSVTLGAMCIFTTMTLKSLRSIKSKNMIMASTAAEPEEEHRPAKRPLSG
jgi:glycosyltransferase involved in cell wall biosynthesis